MQKSILEVVHESADDLLKAGVLAQTTMREFDALCLPQVRELSGDQIKAIRNQLNTSQGVFAQYLNTTKSTVQAWEQGKKKPSGPSLKLINLVSEKGLAILR